MRILFLANNVLSRRDYERFGMPLMIKKGHRVDIIDVTRLIHPQVPQNRDHYPDLKEVAIHVAENVESLGSLTKIRDEADTIFSMFGSVGVEPNNVKIHKWLCAAPGTYVKPYCDTFPGNARFKGEAKHIRERVRDIRDRWRAGQISLSRSIMTRLPQSWMGVRMPDYVVYGGRRSPDTNRLHGRKTIPIWAHSYDYEIFRGLREEITGQTNTAVFIDEYLPYHPDLAVRGQEAPVDPDNYYACLRRFFDKVEATLGLEVVIAACPRADYDKRPDYFGGRRVVMFRSAELVAQSRLVIAHRSTAINFAILFRKPLILTATRDIYRHSSQTPYFDGLAAALGKSIQFFDDADDVDLSDPFAVDDALYERYVEDYIKTGQSPRAPYWQIVVDCVNTSGIARI